MFPSVTDFLREFDSLLLSLEHRSPGSRVLNLFVVLVQVRRLEHRSPGSRVLNLFVVLVQVRQPGDFASLSWRCWLHRYGHHAIRCVALIRTRVVHSQSEVPVLFELAHRGTKPGDACKTSSCSDVCSTRSSLLLSSKLLSCVSQHEQFPSACCHEGCVPVAAPCTMITSSFASVVDEATHARLPVVGTSQSHRSYPLVALPVARIKRTACCLEVWCLCRREVLCESKGTDLARWHFVVAEAAHYRNFHLRAC